jgi:hypothetical protein
MMASFAPSFCRSLFRPSANPAADIKGLLGFVSQKALAPPTQINVERRRHVFASALPLHSLQLVHGAIELSVYVSIVAEKLVGCMGGRQTKRPRFGVFV